MIQISISIGVVLCFWLFGVWYANDLSLPRKKAQGFKRAVVIFPHPDDEAGHCGGLIRALKQRGTDVALVVLTCGERGTDDASLNMQLKTTRRHEMQQAAAILQAAQLIQEDFGDGLLSNKSEKLQSYLRQILATLRPDLVITYDLAGEYGHPDHMVTAELVTTLIKAEHPATHLWYATFPAKILAMAQLPSHMANDPNFASKRAPATARIWVGFGGVMAKIRAIYAHRSQRRSFARAIPFGLPIWLVYSLGVYEYIHEANGVTLEPPTAQRGTAQIPAQ